MLTISLLNLKTIKKSNIHLNFNLAKISLKYILITIPCSLLGSFISKILLHIFNNFFSGLIGGGFAMISCVILIQMFNLFNVFELKTIIKHKHKKA